MARHKRGYSLVESEMREMHLETVTSSSLFVHILAKLIYEDNGDFYIV